MSLYNQKFIAQGACQLVIIVLLLPYECFHACTQALQDSLSKIMLPELAVILLPRGFEQESGYYPSILHMHALCMAKFER